jgi:hypothetical protein
MKNNDDGLDFFRGALIGLPLGLLAWAIVLTPIILVLR